MVQIFFTSDKTYAEMLEAYNGGKSINGTISLVLDSTTVYNIIAWDKNDVNGNDSIYLYTELLGSGQSTQGIIVGLVEGGIYLSIAQGDIVPNT